MIQFVCIEGNIGAGKSTLLQTMKSAGLDIDRPVLIQPEPVDEWVQEGWLDKFYKSRKETAFAFQTVVLRTYKKKTEEAREWLKTHPDGIVVMERSAYSALQIFAKLSMDEMEIKELEYIASEYKVVTPDLFVHLQVDTKAAMERIKRRGRPEEKGISKEDLESIDANITQAIKGFPSIRVDANTNEHEVAEKAIALLRETLV